MDLFWDREDEWHCDALMGPFYETGPHYVHANVAVAETRPDDAPLAAWERVPFAVFEILDYGDQWGTMMLRLAAFEAIGVPQVWVISCGNGSFARYHKGSLSMNEKEFRHGRIQFELAEIDDRRQSKTDSPES